MNERGKKYLWLVSSILIIIITISFSYGWGFDEGVDSVKTTPVVTQAQRIKELESTVEKLVNNEQISAETALKLDALETEVLDHFESHVDTVTTEGTATP